MNNFPFRRIINLRGGRVVRLAALLFVSLVLSGCTTSGRVREVDGQYRKVYPDPNGGWYYVDSHTQKVHLDELPPEGGLMPKEHSPGAGAWE